MNKNILSIFLIIFIIALIVYIGYTQVKDYYTQRDPMILKLKEIVEKIAPQAVSKVNIFKGKKSYTINKKDIYLCLEDEHGEYYSTNALLYVLGHEIAHTICKSIGHTEEFDTIFDQFLKKAEELGYYNPNIKVPDNYCEY